MLFNSYIFLFAFLPLTWLVYVGLQRAGRFDVGWLVVMSFTFYGWWNWHYVPLLAASVLFNFWAGRMISRMPLGEAGIVRRRLVLTAAILVNVALLGYFKYANFFLATAAELDGVAFTPLNIVLPLGISFFTFTQIAFLVDAYRNEAIEYDFQNYSLFVSYFPHLIAGPILHHKQVMPQFADRAGRAVNAETVALGLTILIIGLFKKVVLADSVAPFADRVFAQSPDAVISMVEGAGGTLAYTMQLYFDFSGYCDMAIGVSLLFGVNLPINFNSPYKSRSIVEFWRRWHMTLSQFLRDYIYFALGGNRKGVSRRYINLLATMLIGGFWHGAGWTFIIWGGLHGVFLVINHVWRDLSQRLGLSRFSGRWWSSLFAWAMTFAAVNVAWVFFRADTLQGAVNILKGLLGFNGILPARWAPGATSAVVSSAEAPSAALAKVDPATVQMGGQAVVWILALTVIALLMPNTQQITGYVRRVMTVPDHEAVPLWLRWQPSALWAAGCGAMGAACIYMLGNSSRFLYFQF